MAMEKSVDYMVHEFAAVRTGKASPGLVENVDVHAYGSTMKLKQLALITTPEARLLVVQPFDAALCRTLRGRSRNRRSASRLLLMEKSFGSPSQSCQKSDARNWCGP